MKNFKTLLESVQLILEAKESSMLPIIELSILNYLGKPSYEGLNETQKKRFHMSVETQRKILKEKLKGFSQHECSWIIQEFINNSKYKDSPNHLIWHEDFSKVSSLVIAYNKLKKNPEVKKDLKNDLMKYTYNTLREDVKRLEGFILDEGNNEVIHNRGDWKVYKLDSYNESMKLINNNQNSWCIKELENFEETYQKPFFAFFKKGKPYACGNLEYNQFNLKDVKDDSFIELDKQFESVVKWLLFDYLKIKGLKYIGGDMEIFLKSDINEYKKLFTLEALNTFLQRELCEYASLGNINKVKEIVGYGIIDISKYDNKSRNALRQAVQNGKTEIVKFLLDSGIDTNLINKKDGSILVFACNYNNLEIIKLLLNHGEDVNSKDHSHQTGLMLAAYKNHEDIVKFLLSQGRKVNEKTDIGLTALILAGHQTNIDIVKLLISHGADINAKTDNGNTLLIFCVKKGWAKHHEIIKILLDAGADYQIRDDEGFSILEIADRAGNREAINLLKQHGAKE